MSDFNVEWVKNKNTRLVEGVPLVFHCHHYNCHLQKTIDDAKIVDGIAIQIDGAREVVYDQMKSAFSKHSELDTPKKKLEFAAELFKLQGFGIINFAKVSEKGGVVKCPVSHYAKGWTSKWGKREKPLCYFNTGFVAGTLAAVYGKPRYYFDVEETACLAVKDKYCEYTVQVR